MQSIQDQNTGITTSLKVKRSGLTMLKDNTSNTPIKSKTSLRKGDNKENNKPVNKKTHTVYMDPKPKKTVDKVTQTESVGLSDLTSATASAGYWERLAARRGEDLDRSLNENRELQGRVERLTRENGLLEDISQGAEMLATVLQEVLGEDETTKELIDSISQIRESRKAITVCDTSVNTSVCDEPSTFLEYDCSHTEDEKAFLNEPFTENDSS